MENFRPLSSDLGDLRELAEALGGLLQVLELTQLISPTGTILCEGFKIPECSWTNPKNITNKSKKYHQQIQLISPTNPKNITFYIQSGASSLAKHGGAYFSAVYGSIEDPVAAPGPCKPQVC